MLERNQKLIDAIIAKADRECPGALAMIGIYGSFLTGDIHEKSDLDLMILINDPRGYALARTFLQDDIGVGHDLYCTTWEMLESDANFNHPHISKLMDSRIVYCADEGYLIRLDKLRKQALQADTRKAAESALRDAEHAFTLAVLAQDMSSMRVHAGEMIHHTFSAIALLNKRYFHLGTRRVFDEIDTMERKPKELRSLVDAVIGAGNEADIKFAVAALMQAVQTLFQSPVPSPEVFPGTYEEMFSNWRNKMYLAAELGNRYLSFDSMCGLDSMLRELGFLFDVLGRFDPEDLTASAKAYDEIIETYRREYDNAGIAVQRYPNVDAFIEDYLKKETAI